MEAVVASASHEDRDQELEDLWFDLLALKKLCGLLRRTEAENFVPHGEIKDRLDEKSRNLLKKLLDGATQQSLQHQQTNTVACEEQQHHPTTEQESELLLMMHNEDEWRTKELEFAGKQHLQGECHQLHTMSGVDGPPPPPPKRSFAISRTFSSTAAPEPQTELNGCPDCYFERLNSGGPTRNLLLPLPNKNKTMLQDPLPRRGQSHRRRHPIHGDHRVKSKEQSRRLIHRDRSVKRSRQSQQSAAGTSPSIAATKSTQQRSKAEPAADRSDPIPEGTSMISCRLVCDPAQLKLVGDSLALESRWKNDDPVLVKSKEPSRNETVDTTLTGFPNRGIEPSVAFDRTGKMFQGSTRTDEEEQVPRRNPSSLLSKRSNQSSIIMRREQPSHSGTTESRRRHHRLLPSIRRVEKDNGMEKNGEDEFEGSHRRSKQPPRASSRKAFSRLSMYSGSRATRSSSDSIESSQFNSRSHSLFRVKSHVRVARERSKSGRTASHSIRPSMGRVARSKKKPSNHSLSRHSRRTDVPPDKPLKEHKEEQEGKLGRLKNKLSIILHHHHNHHHHLLHRSSEDKGVAVSAERRHRSLWEYLLGSTHSTSRTERKAPQHHLHGRLHALLKELIQHMFLFEKRKRRPTLEPKSRVKKLGRQVGARTVHWWQRLRRRPRFFHVATRLRQGTGRRIK